MQIIKSQERPTVDEFGDVIFWGVIFLLYRRGGWPQSLRGKDLFFFYDCFLVIEAHGGIQIPNTVYVTTERSSWKLSAGKVGSQK